MFAPAGILWRPLRCKLKLNTKILKVCAKLHNFCIDHNVPDDAEGAASGACTPVKVRGGVHQETGCPVERIDVIKRKGRPPRPTSQQRDLPEQLLGSLSVDARTRILVAYCHANNIARPEWAIRRQPAPQVPADDERLQVPEDDNSGGEL